MIAWGLRADAAGPSLDEQLQAAYRSAEQAVSEGDARTADFWMGRYLGLTAFNQQTPRGYADLIPLFERRADLIPTAFVSGEYSEDFLEFFIHGPQLLWGVPDELIGEGGRVAVRTFTDEQYFVQVVASPVLEAWAIMREPPYSMVILPLGATDPPAVIVAGRLQHGEPVQHFPKVPLNADGHFLHFVWPIELHDLEGDGTPEIWLRYNEAGGSGFSQVLEIYKIAEDQLALFKRFEGLAEGIARRLPDGRVEVAEGTTDRPLTGHLGYDQHQVETFEFRQGEFVKVGERYIPHLLWSDEWQRYYFGDDHRIARRDTR